MPRAYRLVHFPASEHEDLTTIWLWSEQKGVVSHETAHMLHNLSDVLPRKAHLTLPASWAKRRVRVPKGVFLYHEDVPKKEQLQLGAIPVTSVHRTLLDCASSHVPLEFIEAALRQAHARGFIDRQEVKLIQARARTA